MNYKSHFISIFFCYLLISLTSSCKKDDQDAVITGDINSSLNIYRLDTLINTGFQNTEKKFNIDADLDGTNDFQIICSNLQCPGNVWNRWTALICLNNQSFVKTNTVTDTTFINTFSYTYNNSEGISETHTYKSYNYYRLSKDDSIKETQKITYLVPFKRSEELKGYRWQSDTIILGRSDNLKYISESSANWVKYTEIRISYHNIFPDRQIRYIGIKKEVHGKEKLGWIKIMVAYNHVISILEFALQK